MPNGPFKHRRLKRCADGLISIKSRHGVLSPLKMQLQSTRLEVWAIAGLERLRAKDMFLTLNCFLSARALNNRQEPCDVSLNHVEAKSEFSQTSSNRRDLQQRRAKQLQHICKKIYHKRFGFCPNSSIQKAMIYAPSLNHKASVITHVSMCS